MARSEALKRAQERYAAKLKDEGVKTTKGFYLKCHVEHDADIIEKLERVGQKNTYIKELIRNDIEKQG